jgi:hypothetical protein
VQFEGRTEARPCGGPPPTQHRLDLPDNRTGGKGRDPLVRGVSRRAKGADSRALPMPWTEVVKIPDKPCRGPTILLDQVGNAFQEFWPPAEPDRDRLEPSVQRVRHTPEAAELIYWLTRGRPGSEDAPSGSRAPSTPGAIGAVGADPGEATIPRRALRASLGSWLPQAASDRAGGRDGAPVWRRPFSRDGSRSCQDDTEAGHCDRPAPQPSG